MRAAVGDDKLTYLGYSVRHPDRLRNTPSSSLTKVRAMILDGAVDPDADPIQADLAQAAAFQQAFTITRRRHQVVRTRWAPSGQGRRGLPRPGRPLVDSRCRPADPRGLGLATPSSAPSWRCTRPTCGGT